MEAPRCVITALDLEMPYKHPPPFALPADLAARKGTAHQRGVTLIELMVGIAIGLLVVAVATAALMVSRGVTGNVSDASSIQQQAAYALRVLGQQTRQAGSLFLNLDSGGAGSVAPALAPVAFESRADASGAGNAFDITVSGTTDIVSGTSTSVTPAYRRYLDPVFTAATGQSLVRNCVGGPGDSSTDQRIESAFQLVGNELRCGGNGAPAQAIIQNVANFQVRYLLQDNTSLGDSSVRYSVAAPASWSTVQGVEVCLVLYGNESIDLPPGSNYIDCDGTSVLLGSLAGVRRNRTHLLFRSVYQLRSQGLIGSVL